jgi:hypothetical protein
MTWHDTFPDPTMYYHVPKKLLRPVGALEDRLDAGGSDLRLWTPRRAHQHGDPYRQDQRGHLARITLNVRTPDGYRCQYDVHENKKGITATLTSASQERRLTLNELEGLATLVRQELRDYHQPNTNVGKIIETIFHYRRRSQHRITKDVNNIMDAYYAQEAGKTITIN